MASAAGWVLAAGAVSAANEAIFVPIETHQPPWETMNWRIVPATAVLAIILTGMDKMSPGFGAGLGMLVFLAVLVIPVGHQPSPIDNLSKVIGVK